MLDEQSRKNSLIIPFALFVLGLLLFIPSLGTVHLFDWDEINFAEAAREMLLTGEFLRVHIDFQPFWEKPPLFLWMQAISMHFFGINESAARFPNAMCGALTLPLLYLLGQSLHDKKTGLLWSLMYAGSFLPHFYFKTGIIDPWFNLFIMIGMLLPTLPFFQERHLHSGFLSGISIGLAVMTKGPVAYLIAMSSFAALMAIDMYNGKVEEVKRQFSWVLSMTISTIFTASLWFGLEFMTNGSWFIEEFVNYQIRLFSTGDAGHSGPIYYHAMILLIGCFPASVFAVDFMVQKKLPQMQIRIMLALFWTTLILFSIVKTKIVHYSSLCYFPLTYMAALSLKQVIATRHVSLAMRIGLWIGVILWTVLLLAVPLIGLNLTSLLPLIQDEFAKLNLTAPVQWTGIELAIGIVYAIIACMGLILLQRKEMIFKGIIVVSGATMIALMTFLPIIAPKIEGYTQASIIDFYKSMKHKDVLLYPTGFKSYAHLFYSEKRLPRDFPDNRSYTDEELMNGASKKPVFFIAKVRRAKELRGDFRVQHIQDFHGFSVFRVITQQKSDLK